MFSRITNSLSASVLTLAFALLVFSPVQSEAQVRLPIPIKGVPDVVYPRRIQRPTSAHIVNHPKTDPELSNKQQIILSDYKRTRLLQEAIAYAQRPGKDGLSGLLANAKSGGMYLPLGGGEGGGDGPGPRGGCGGTALGWVIANEITYGSGGPHVPTHVDYRLGDVGNRWSMWGGQDVVVDAPPLDTGAEIPLGDGSQELIITAMAAYPDFTDPWFYGEYDSNDPVNAVVLVDGDNLANVLASKGVQPPFGGQQSIDTILASYNFLENGTIKLGSNQMILMMELGTNDPNSSAFDVQDFGMLIQFPCPLGDTEVVLRDSIGPDNTWTDGNFPFDSTKSIVGNPDVIPVQLTSDVAVHLTSMRVISSRSPGTFNWANYSHKLLAWSSWNNILSDHSNGDLLATTLTGPTSGPNPFGTSSVWQGWTSFETDELIYDLSSYNLTVPAGGSIWLGVMWQGGSPFVGEVESLESGSTDVVVRGTVGSPTVLNIADFHGPGDPISHYSGRVAIEVIGTEQ